MSRPKAAGVYLLVVTLVVGHFLLHVGFGLGRGAPDLLTIGLLLLAREVGIGTAALVGLLFGLLEDALGTLAFGANAVAMTVIGVLGAVTRDLFVGDSKLFVLSYFFLGKFTRDFLHWMLGGEGLRQPFMDQVLVQGGIGAIYVALVGMALVALVGLVGDV